MTHTTDDPRNDPRDAHSASGARLGQALNALAACVETLVKETTPTNLKSRHELNEAKRLIGEYRAAGSGCERVT